MKIFGFGLCLIFSATASATPGFPEGRFAGTGTKTFDDGTTKTYKISIHSADNQLDFRYEFPEKDPIDFSLTLTFDKPGFFKIADIGQGYCGATTCHYSVKLGDTATEEWTYFFDGDKLHKTGSLITPNKKNYWEESLTRTVP